MMFGPIVKAKCPDHSVGLKGIVQGGDGIHPPAQQNDDLHRRADFIFRLS